MNESICYKCCIVIPEEEYSWKQTCDRCSKQICALHRYGYSEYDDGALCIECMPLCVIKGCEDVTSTILEGAKVCILQKEHVMQSTWLCPNVLLWAVCMSCKNEHVLNQTLKSNKCHHIYRGLYI